MAGSAHLMSNKFNVAQVLTAAQTELLELFGDPGVNKVLIWDPDLIAPMSIIADATFIRKSGVSKMVRLPIPNLTERYPDAVEYLFLVRPSLSSIDLVMKAISSSPKKGDKRFVVAFTPHKDEHCISKMKELGFVHGSTTPIHFFITEYHLDILPLDSDLISLNVPTAFKDLYVDLDPTPVYQAARAIGKLQALFGVIPKIYGKGRNAKVVADLLKSVRQELEKPQASTANQKMDPNIDALILLDRNLDLVTPLSTQLTYEGLIDEIYGIRHATATFPCQRFSEEVLPKDEASTASGTLAVKLDSNDSLFSSMRDLNFRAVGGYLTVKAKDITALYETRRDAKTVSELKSFVNKLPHLQQEKHNLSKHTTIAELVKTVTDRVEFLSVVHAEHDFREEDYSDKPHPFVEKLLGNPSQHPIEKVLRLICLQSCTSGGLRPRLLETYKREILHGYGYHHLSTLLQLEKAGLLRSQEEKGGLLRAQEIRGFPAVRKQLQLVSWDGEDDQSHNPQHLTYLYSGYAPLSVKLVELLSRKQGFAAFDEVTRQLPGPPAFMMTQPHKHHKNTVGNTVLVFFIGGVTHAEISAFRYLTSREDSVVEYTVGSTHITNGTGLVSSVIEETPLYHPSTTVWDTSDGGGSHQPGVSPPHQPGVPSPHGQPGVPSPHQPGVPSPHQPGVPSPHGQPGAPPPHGERRVQ